eukprot:CAMPEP_0181181892 /NCGR_PEP_ID=MMETSP1096-20121128/7583_1 /TAXON_ID=156174 ORGANISM="Chrysochromulina ericina, Strain CCMP281" /NCGR_SAMPLE_ID=MMETSP1096 /ASSEMBLY_ACC=CAM_ASM_000453 /LENGTH=320 /DNA_ID=CAMNT_0023270433 /DNA_START=123 /DNA_END=1085 /DNA_ORIENTATION=-
MSPPQASSEGLIAVLGVGTEEAGTSTAHLMSFSTGVMLYLSFMDIIADTTSKIGEFYANVAFFLGMVIFLMLEFCLPEVEGSQMAEIFGLNLRVDLRKTPQLRDTSGSEHVEPMEPLPVAMSSGELGSSSLRRRDRHQTAPLEFAGNPQPTALKQKPTTSEHPRAPSRSPVHRPAQTAMTEAEQHQGSPVGGQSIRTKANSIAFTGMMAMVSISLHNIPEGIAVYLTCLKGVKSGLPLAIAMAFHNIPEGMAVAGPLFAATKSKKKAFSRVDHLAAFTLSASQSTHDTAQKSHKLAAFVIASFLPCRRCSPQPYLVYSRS